MKKIIPLCILYLSQLLGDTYPNQDDVISSTHIMFEWPTETNDTQWQLQFSTVDFTNMVSVEVHDDDDDGYLQYFNDNSADFFTWNTTYQWQWKIFPFGDWSDPIDFSIGPSKSNTIVTIHDESNYAEGYTIFGSADGAYSAIIDMNGQEIWNSANQNIVYYNTDHQGSFFGTEADEELCFPYPSTEFTLNNGVIWKEPNDEYAHHEFLQLPSGDYMGIVHEYQNGPILATGYIRNFYLGTILNCAGGETCIADGVTNEWPWQGDRIIIWDKDTKEVKWYWSTFDYFNMMDYETSLWDLIPQPLSENCDEDDDETWGDGANGCADADCISSGGFFDWTHINAFDLGLENYPIIDIYFSTRNLSRITKIQIEYNESTGDISGGNIIWNMGHEHGAGDVTFGNDLGFSLQHGLTLTDEGNIVFLDNGNYAQAYWGAEYPTTRALEIAVTGTADNYSANIVFEYQMDENLFGSQAGNAQKLNNGNYLINTIGGGVYGNAWGTSYEVSPTGELVWEASYQTYLLWRASRITTLHPVAEEDSCTVGDMNGDISYNVLDVIALADCVLTQDCSGCAGDINGDISYNVLDIIALADCVLNQNCSDL